MRLGTLSTLAVLAALSALGALGALGALVLTAATQELPQGPGRDIVAKRCISCHEADLITQQRLTRVGWGRSVDKMVRWGATVETDEREPILDYLAAHFAPRPAAANIVATAPHEGTYKRACLSCHDADLVASQRLTRAGWVRTVDKMIRWGAVVSDADKDGLIDYLATRYPQR
jgi:mono/diheme cytochrome c family protein